MELLREPDKTPENQRASSTLEELSLMHSREENPVGMEENVQLKEHEHTMWQKWSQVMEIQSIADGEDGNTERLDTCEKKKKKTLFRVNRQKLS
jgi:hypothetical protein